MNPNSEVFVLGSAKVDSLTVANGVTIYKAKVENYSKDEVVIVITDDKNRSFIKSVPKEKVYESYQKALEAIDEIVKAPTQTINISSIVEDTKENKPQQD